MQTFIPRQQENKINKHLKSFPCVILLGSRQVGKSTLAKKIISETPISLYIDLEDPRDINKLSDPITFLEANRNRLICIDEVQRIPEIFQVFRSYLDQSNKAGQLLLLGSASKELIQQSSETLAGRISYIEIPPFVANEVEDQQRLWLQGGYPNSYLNGIELSFDWRMNYIRTFLEMDIPALGIKIPATTLRRFWTMLAHLNGSLLNASKIASSMGVSTPTIKHYLDILEGTFVIRQLKPFHTNTKKRLIKSPKIYIRDSGLIHCLLGIESFNDLLGHPILGTSYESYVIESLIQHFPRYIPSFYRSSSGAEIDLVLEKGNRIIAIEIKSSSTPVLTQGFFEAQKVICPTKSLVIAPIVEPYPLKQGIWVYNLMHVLDSSFLE